MNRKRLGRPSAEGVSPETPLVMLTVGELEQRIEACVRVVVNEALASARPPPRFMDVEQVAELLGVNQRTIKNWVRDRQFPVYRTGSLLRFDRDLVERWVRSTGRNSDARGK